MHIGTIAAFFMAAIGFILGDPKIMKAGLASGRLDRQWRR